MRIRDKGDKVAAQERVFQELVPQLARASVWRDRGVERGMDYEAFRSAVQLNQHADLAPHISRMQAGEGDVLWPGTCQIYCRSSGTSTGRPRAIPVTEPMLRHFKQCSLNSTLWYTARIGHAGVFRGRHLFLGGTTAMSPVAGPGAFEAYEGDLSGIAALNLPRWVERHYYEPGTEIAQLEDWTQKVSAIVERTMGVDISLLAGSPEWVLGLANALKAGSRSGKARAQHLQGIWPNLECFVHGSIPVAPYEDELREILGPTVNFHEVYPAAEAFVAAQDSESIAGLRLMADAGVFYEFVPMSEFDEARAPILGARAVPLSEVETGVDYALVVTTPAGLARYLIGDVVRFVSKAPPRIEYVGRTGLQLNAFGEGVSESEVTGALVANCSRNGWTIVNFHVAPLPDSSVTGRGRGRHEWWVELKPGTLSTPTGPVMAPEIDHELRRLNPAYEAKRASGLMDPPWVRLVMPGVFEHWMRFHGRWGGRNKVPRCRSDRVIADELGDALQFARD
ncbi:MAG TPA: GH3 auxin-responsive promoter family protein [Opitutaceae bacterium]